MNSSPYRALALPTFSAGQTTHGALARSPRLSACVGAALLVAALAWATNAHGAEGLTMELTAVKRTVAVDADGRSKESFAPVATIVPGEEIVYTVQCENRGSASTSGAIVTLPIPPETRFVAGSADQPDTDVVYSVDRGATFSRLEDLTITNAAGAVRPAQSGDVTAVRWTLLGELASGQKRRTQCRAVLR